MRPLSWARMRAGEEYRTKNALLVAELEAAKLEKKPADEIGAIARELLERCLDERDGAAARAAFVEFEACSDRSEPGNEMLLDYFEARLASLENDVPKALGLVERATSTAREHELSEDLPWLLLELGETLERADRKEDAKRAREEAALGFEAIDIPARAALTLAEMAQVAAFEEAPALFKRAVSLAESSGEPGTLGMVLLYLGRWHVQRDEYLPARRALDRALEVTRDAGVEPGVAACLLELAWLEVEAFHHDAAIELATRALDVVDDDWHRGWALDARATARHRLHDHLGARADLLEATRAFEAADAAEWVKSCKQRASGDRLLHYLHYLPSWVFRHKDMSTRESAFRRPFQPFPIWIVTVASVWSGAWLFAATRVPRGGARLLFTTLAVLPPAVLISGSTVLVVLLVAQKLRQKREE